MKVRSATNHLQGPRQATILVIAALLGACSSTDDPQPATTPPSSPGVSSTVNSAMPGGMNDTPATNTSPTGSATGSPAAGEGNPTPMLNGTAGSSGSTGSNGGTSMGAGGMGAGGMGPVMGAAGMGPVMGAAGMGPVMGAAGSPAVEPPPAGCPSPAFAPGDSTRTLNVGGVNRTYVLHVPSTYTGNAAVPLLFDFHGLGGNGQNERNSSSFVAVTQAESVIMAFPSGTSDGSGNGFNVGTCCASGDDVGFTRAIVAEIESLACIDKKRIYVTGFSNGGGMSHKLACEAADIFAAAAPASFDFGQDNVDDCQPSRPISVVMQRGTADPAVPFNGGATPVTNRIVFIGAQATFDKWNELDGCTGAPQNIGNNCTKVAQCGAGVENTLCVIQGGGHQPPMANLIWPLLRQYSMP